LSINLLIPSVALLKDSLSNCPFGKELLEHNLVIFRNGEGALQVLPGLLDVIPEAKLNLVTHYLRQVEQPPLTLPVICITRMNSNVPFRFKHELKEAFQLIQDVEPTLPIEFILKGTVYTLMGQETNNVSSVRQQNLPPFIKPLISPPIERIYRYSYQVPPLGW